MNAEKAAGIILPSEQEMMVAQQMQELGNQKKGKSEIEPEIDDSSTEAPESPGAPKGGEI